MTAHEPLVAGTVVKVHFSGQATWTQTQFNFTPLPYTLSLFVQNADVLSQCASSYSAELQDAINVNMNASESITGFVMNDSIDIGPPAAPGSEPRTADSLPFGIKPGLPHVLLCAYTRYVSDDVAYDSLRCTWSNRHAGSGPVRQARAQCEVALRLQRSTDAGFTRPGHRAIVLSATLDQHGHATLQTHALSPGSYRITMSSNGLVLPQRRLQVS